MRILIVCFFIASLFSCKKKKETDPITEVKTTLSANSIKDWRLSKLYINGNSQVLTSGQLVYKKTYKIDGTWLDTDGYSGTYSIESPLLLKEVTTVGGTGTISYKINFLTSASLDIEYTYSNQTYRFVYVQ